MAAKKKRAKVTKTKAKAKSAKPAAKRVAKKAPAKKAAKKATKAKTVKAVSSGPLRVSQVFTKSALLATLSERTGVSKKEVSALMDELANVVEGHLKKGGPGKFTLPGMLKMSIKNSPARKARKGINPFTGEPTVFAAKPASRKVKVTALKALKEMVQ